MAEPRTRSPLLNPRFTLRGMTSGGAGACRTLSGAEAPWYSLALAAPASTGSNSLYPWHLRLYHLAGSLKGDNMIRGIFALGLIIASTPCWSAPVSAPGPLILAEGDCGRDYHRDDHGRCVPNWREMEGRECPRGYHPDGRRCFPN